MIYGHQALYGLGFRIPGWSRVQRVLCGQTSLQEKHDEKTAEGMAAGLTYFSCKRGRTPCSSLVATCLSVVALPRTHFTISGSLAWKLRGHKRVTTTAGGAAVAGLEPGFRAALRLLFPGILYHRSCHINFAWPLFPHVLQHYIKHSIPSYDEKANAFQAAIPFGFLLRNDLQRPVQKQEKIRRAAS